MSFDMQAFLFLIAHQFKGIYLNMLLDKTSLAIYISVFIVKDTTLVL